MEFKEKIVIQKRLIIMKIKKKYYFHCQIIITIPYITDNIFSQTLF